MRNPPATHVGPPGAARPRASSQYRATPIFLLPSARVLPRSHAADHRAWWAIASSFVAILFVVGATVASVVALQTVRDMITGVYPLWPCW